MFRVDDLECSFGIILVLVRHRLKELVAVGEVYMALNSSSDHKCIRHVVDK